MIKKVDAANTLRGSYEAINGDIENGGFKMIPTDSIAPPGWKAMQVYYDDNNNATGIAYYSDMIATELIRVVNISYDDNSNPTGIVYA